MRSLASFTNQNIYFVFQNKNDKNNWLGKVKQIKSTKKIFKIDFFFQILNPNIFVFSPEMCFFLTTKVRLVFPKPFLVDSS
jgi:hypothetical protein